VSGDLSPRKWTPWRTFQGRKSSPTVAGPVADSPAELVAQLADLLQKAANSVEYGDPVLYGRLTAVVDHVVDGEAGPVVNAPNVTVAAVLLQVPRAGGDESP
jgi:hypothetical protein